MLTPLVSSSEEAVEYDELSTYLRLNDAYDPDIEEDRPLLPAQPIGVPGAVLPSEMAKPEHQAFIRASSSPAPSPSRGKTSTGSANRPGHDSDAQDGMNKVVQDLRKRNEEEFDIGSELSGYGLQGVKVTHDDLAKLVEELGLDGDEAGDLVKGLSDMTVKDGEVAPSTTKDTKTTEK